MKTMWAGAALAKAFGLVTPMKVSSVHTADHQALEMLGVDGTHNVLQSKADPQTEQNPR